MNLFQTYIQTSKYPYVYITDEYNFVAQKNAAARMKTVKIKKFNENIPLYNSRIVDTYIKLIKKKYPYVDIPNLLKSAKMEDYEVADQGHWFTQEQINLFHEKLVQLTDNENISREAGRFTTSLEATGMIKQYILGMLEPVKVYSSISKAAGKLTRSATYNATILGKNIIEIKVTPKKGVKERQFQCQNRIGFFEAISLMFNNKTPRIDHPECVFKGNEHCKYIISWEKSLSDVFKRIKYYVIIMLTASLLASFFIKPYFSLTVLLPLFIIIMLIVALISETREKHELLHAFNNLEITNDRLVDQIEINYNNALMVNEIGLVVSMQTSIEDILQKVTQVFEKRLNYDRGIILLANKNETKLVFRAGFGYNKSILKFLQKTEFRLDTPKSKGIFVVSFKEKKPFIINDIHDIHDDLSVKSLDFVKRIKSQSFICCPIICDGKSIGILAADNIESKRPLVHSDMSLLMGAASVIGISIRNADLNHAREQQFRSTLQVLAASIDARDPLTAGHSEKVTEYAIGICRELNLSKEYVEVIRVSAALHDYGKIGVPDALLKKVGRLTEDEYEIVKTHAQRTREILEQINFQGMFSQVPAIAGAHHEKLDGSGYPHGLKGDDIPMGAQIIAVADFFEAITSNRHYRDPMPEMEAIRLLREAKGSKFKEEIVESFINYISKQKKDIYAKLVKAQ